MCTAISMSFSEHYFGRNLDMDISYNEEICVMPRNFPLKFSAAGEMQKHYAVIGMAAVIKGVPLFYDAANEYGLAMAGLNFPENAYYGKAKNNADNIAPFELIPWILGQCKTVNDAKKILGKINITDISFDESLPNSPLHWMLSDKEQSLVIEPCKKGLEISDNPANVLTNNPPFRYQMENLSKYTHLKTDNSGIGRDKKKKYSDYCQGLGAIGLPGDMSSASRFVRAAFGLKNISLKDEKEEGVTQLFHLLSSTEMIKGLVKTDNNTLDFTLYTSCINTNRGLYYYTTYSNRQISCVDMHKTDLTANLLSRYKLNTEQNIYFH